MEWANETVTSEPLRRLTQREKRKATTVFMPKVRKQRMSALDRPPREATLGETRPYRAKPDSTATKKPVPRKSANRRVRQTSDLPAPAMQKKSDRNRGRG